MSQNNGYSNSQSQEQDAFFGNENEIDDWSEIMDMSDSSIKEDSENVDETITPEKLLKLLDETLTNCHIDDLDKKIFSTYLADSSQQFIQLIAEINKKLLGKRRNESDIKAKLKICEDHLECWQKCIKHLKSLTNVSITKIKSFPNNLFNVIKSALNFCEMSKNADINNLNEEIISIFRKANEIMNGFLSISDSVINFNVEQEAELNILSTVINEIGDTAVMVNRLDLKTITGIWKQFGKLATLHGEKIKLKFSERVTQHFDSLAETIVTLIFSAVKGNQQKVKENRIMCCKMLLIILNRLWNVYDLSVSDENAHSIVKLLVQMYRYSSPCLIATNVDSSIVKFIDINISTNLENFFNSVFNNERVFKAFFEFGRGDDVDAIGYHFLTLNIMRKLIKLSYDIQRKWILEPSILDVAFTNIDLLQLEICLGKLQLSISRNLGDHPKSVTIYEETFIMIWGLICQVPSSDFGKIENLLVKSLMSGNYWSSLLTVDIWCIISRCGSSQLCYDHLKYFLKVYDRLSERESSLEVFFLSFLIKRLYRTLSESKKDFFIENLDVSGSDFWNPLSGVLTDNGKSIVEKRTTKIGNRISENYQLLIQKPSIKSWTCFTSLLKMTEICSREQDKQTMETISNIWNYIAEVIEFCEGIYLILVSELMTALFRCHVPCKESFNDVTISSILKSITSLLPYTLPHVKIKLLNWLKDILIHTTEKISHLSSPISELYARLLEDETPWVRQEAFEYFNDFTRNSPNEDLVGSVLQIIIDKTKLSESLPAYISSTSYYKLTGYPNIETYLRQLLGSCGKNLYQHTCYEVNEREDKFPKLEDSTNCKAGFNVNDKIDNICNELDDLLEYKNEISQENFEKLRHVFVKICDQRVNSS